MHHQKRPKWQGMDDSLGELSFPYLREAAWYPLLSRETGTQYVERPPIRRYGPSYSHHGAQLDLRGGYSTQSRYPFTQRSQPYRDRLSQNHKKDDHFVGFERYFDSMLSYPWTELEKQWKETMRRLTENGVVNPAQHVLSEIEDVLLKKFKLASTSSK